MKSFVIIGVGRFGSNLAKTLADLGNEVLAIDDRDDRIQEISDYVTHAVVGDVKNQAVLSSLGVRNYDVGIVALSEDMGTSILVASALKELGMQYVVARATSEIHARLLQKVGADRVVFPERDMGTRLAQNLSMVNILECLDISDKLSIVEVSVPSRWVGKNLRETNARSDFSVNVLAVKRGNRDDIEVPPNPDTIFAKEDIVIVIGSKDHIKKITDNDDVNWK